MVRFGRALQQNPRITKTLHDASLDLTPTHAATFRGVVGVRGLESLATPRIPYQVTHHPQKDGLK